MKPIRDQILRSFRVFFFLSSGEVLLSIDFDNQSEHGNKSQQYKRLEDVVFEFIMI